MIYEQGQLDIFKITAKETEKVISEINEAYDLAYNEVTNEINKIYLKLEGVDPDKYYAEVIKLNRLEKLQDEIADIMGEAFKTSNAATLEAEKLAMSNAYYRNIYQFNQFAGMSFLSLDNDLINYAATGNYEAWKKIKNKIDNAKIYTPSQGTLSRLLKDNNEEALSKLRKTIDSGFIQNKTYKEMSKDIKEVFNGVDGNGGINYKAMNIARTEGGRNLSLGYIRSTDAAVEQGIEMEKMWLAAFSNTRSYHATADRQKVKSNESFTVKGEKLIAPRVGDGVVSARNVINCQCTVINIINGVNPKLRRVRNPTTGENEVFEFDKFDEWIKENGVNYNKSGRLVKKNK